MRKKNEKLGGIGLPQTLFSIEVYKFYQKISTNKLKTWRDTIGFFFNKEKTSTVFYSFSIKYLPIISKSLQFKQLVNFY